MCIIISKPQGIKLPRETYEQCFTKNKDGAGIAYVENGEMVVDKGFFKFEDVYECIKEHEEKEMLIHFRICTHGGISIDNCHPFIWKSKNFKNFEFCIAHNGQLPWGCTKDKSDTACFIEDVLGPQLDVDPWFLDRASGRVLLQGFIGDRNKIVVTRLDKTDNTTTTAIINKSIGTEAMGCWFSNYSYIIYQPIMSGMYGSEWDADVERWNPVTREMEKVKGSPKSGSITQTKLPLLTSSNNPPLKLEKQDYSLSYFSKSDRKLFNRLASDYCREFYNEMVGYSPNNNIHWLRDDVRDMYPGACAWPIEELDKWIMKQIKDYQGMKIPPTINPLHKADEVAT